MKNSKLVQIDLTQAQFHIMHYNLKIVFIKIIQQ